MKQVVQSRDRVLDFWRGVSIFFVVTCHLVSFRLNPFLISFFSAFHYTNVAERAFFTFFTRVFFGFNYYSGTVGVTLFLTISGYIITKILIEEQERSGTIDLRRFYLRRFFRILPAYIFYVLCVAAFISLGWIAIAHFPFACIVFLANTNIVGCTHAFHHFWTLSFEEQFYATWPLFLLIIPKIRHTKSVVIIYAIIAAGLAVKIPVV